MADVPHKHGPNWRVRWVHPDTRKRWPFILGSEPEAWRFKRYVEAAGGRVHPDDPELVHGTWDPARQVASDGDGITFWEFAAKVHENLCENRVITDETRGRYDECIQVHYSDWHKLPMTAIQDRSLLDAKIKQLAPTPGVEICRAPDKCKGKHRPPSRDGKLRHYAPSTVHTILTRAKAVISAAHKSGVIKKDPFAADPLNGRAEVDISKASGYSDRKRIRKPRELLVSQGERQTLLAVAAECDAEINDSRPRAGVVRSRYGVLTESQLHDQIWLMFETGCRIGEVLGFPVDHCHVTNGECELEVEFTRKRNGELGPPKGRKTREVQVSVQLANRLRKYVDGRDPDAALFPAPERGDTGWTYHSWYETRWQRLLEKARPRMSGSLLLHPHALRHNHITWARDEARLDVRDVQKNAGHVLQATTEGYDLTGKSWKGRIHDKLNTAGFVPEHLLDQK